MGSKKKNTKSVNADLADAHLKLIANAFDVSTAAVQLHLITGKGLITACKHLREPWQHLDQHARSLRNGE